MKNRGGTCLEKPKTQTKVKPAREPIKSRIQNGKVKTLNRNALRPGEVEDKWRCSTCTFLNEQTLDICGTCGSEKKVLKSKPVYGGAEGAKRAIKQRNGFKPTKSTKPLK